MFMHPRGLSRLKKRKMRRIRRKSHLRESVDQKACAAFHTRPSFSVFLSNLTMMSVNSRLKSFLRILRYQPSITVLNFFGRISETWPGRGNFFPGDAFSGLLAPTLTRRMHHQQFNRYRPLPLKPDTFYTYS